MRQVFSIDRPTGAAQVLGAITLFAALTTTAQAQITTSPRAEMMRAPTSSTTVATRPAPPPSASDTVAPPGRGAGIRDPFGAGIQGPPGNLMRGMVGPGRIGQQPTVARRPFDPSRPHVRPNVVREPPIQPVRPFVRPPAVGGGTPRIRSLATRVDGPMPLSLVRRIVGANLVGVANCYQVGLQRNAALAGAVQIRFVVGPAGTVDAVTVMQDSLGDPETAQCIALSARQLEFPAPPGGRAVVVTHAYDFRSR